MSTPKSPEQTDSDPIPAERPSDAVEDTVAPNGGAAPEAPDAPDEGEPAPADVTVPAAEWAALQEEKAALEDRLLRLQAEFENYRKRMARERVQARVATTEEVTRRFLAVVDNFDRALAAAEEHQIGEDHLTGWRLIHQQLYDVLRSLGVEPMAVVGERFDPRFHDALSECPHGDVPAGHVAAEVERGYMIADKVLRTAKVTVSSGPIEAADESA